MPSQIDLSNLHESRCGQRRAKRAFSMFFFILVCCLGKDAAGAGAVTAVSFSPTVDSFANQAIGTVSANQPIQLSNTGNSALSISSLALTGTNAHDFAQSNNCGSSLTAGAQCTINVTFKPTASGTRTAAITLTDNAAGSPQTVILIGISSAPIVSLSPSSLAFASRAVGAAGATQTIILINTGTAALRIASLALTGTNAGDFAQSNNCASSVAAGSHCTISVTFTPTASGTRTAAITLTDNATSSPQAVSLTGTGTSSSKGSATSSSSPSITIYPASLTFSSQAVGATSAAQAITLNNTGTTALSIASLALTGTNASNFAQSNNCASSLAAGANCTISVTFTPAASGTFIAAVILTDNATGSPQTVSLFGTGESTGAAASISPSSLTFGNEPVDMSSSSQVVTLNNTGSVALTITSITFTGANAADFAEANTCSSSVVPGGTCVIAILFTPSAAGARAASLSIADNARRQPGGGITFGHGNARRDSHLDPQHNFRYCGLRCLPRHDLGWGRHNSTEFLSHYRYQL